MATTPTGQPLDTEVYPDSIFSPGLAPSGAAPPAGQNPLPTSIYQTPPEPLAVGNEIASTKTPEEAAKVLSLEARTGLPGAFIEQDLPNIEAQANRRDFDAEAFRRDNPKLAAWIAENPNHFAFAKEDLNFLQSLERAGHAFVSGAARVSEQEEMARLLYKDMEDGGLSPSDQLRLDGIRSGQQAAAAEAGKDNGLAYVARQTGYAGRQALSTTGIWAKGAIYGGGAAALAGAGTALVAGQLGPQALLPEELLTVPGAALAFGGRGAKAGALAASFLYSYRMESAFAFDDYRNMKDLDGKPMDRATARNVALGVGVLNAAIETGSDAVILMLSPAYGMLEEGASKAAIKAGLNVKIKQALLQPTIRGTVLKALGKMTGTGFVEGLEELTQALVGAGGREIAQASSGQTFAPDSFKSDWSDAQRQALDAFTGTFVTAAITHGGPHVIEDLRAVKAAQTTEQVYTALAAGKDSKAFKALPEKAQAAVAAVVRDGPFATAHIDTPVWDKIFSQGGVDPREMAAEIMGDGGKAYDKAVAEQTPLPVPMERYARKIAPVADLHQKFTPEIRQSPEAMNGRESREFFQKFEQEAAAVSAPGSAVEQPSAPGPADQARQMIEDQLRAAGRSEAEITHYGQLFKGIVGAIGEQAGISPMELVQRFGPTVQAQENIQAGTKEFQQAKIEPETASVMEKAGVNYIGTVDYGTEGKLAFFNDPETNTTLSLPAAQVSTEEIAKKITSSRKTFEQPAFHGSPHQFDKFSLHQIGTGEGAQAYGWGLYFAGKKEVAEFYRDKLTDPSADRMIDALKGAVEKWQRDLAADPTQERVLAGQITDAQKEIERLQGERKKIGRLYKVDIPEDSKFLHWDLPLSEQPAEVKAAIAKLGYAWATPERTGADFYRAMLSEPEAPGTSRETDSEWASRKLSSMGIAGIKYFDQGSRATAGGEIVSVDKRNGKWFAVIKVTNRFGIGFDVSSDAFTTSMPFDSKQEAQSWAQERIGAGSHNYVVFDDKLVKILGFEQGGEGGTRGRITFGTGRQVNIQLLAKADRSTFLHEMGHFMLETVGDLATAPGATEQIKARHDAILKWLGVENRDQIQEQHHEQFARGFEAYLMEGKAPTQELRSAFASFKVWLTRIYRELKNLNVPLSDDIRATMDRLVATEDQIRAAETEQGLSPLFADPKAAGMDDATAARYLQATDEAHQAATERLGKILMRDMVRAENELYKSEEAKVREEITGVVNDVPVYKAIESMRSDDPDAPITKLSREAVKEIFGDRVKELPSGILTNEGGMHPTVAAEFYGYTSAPEMLDAIAKAETKEALINRLTDERMNELHPDTFKDPELLYNEAMDAVHNEKRAQVMRMELEHLAKNNLPVMKDLIRRVARRMPTDMEIREKAVNEIEQRDVKDLRPAAYQRAERTMARQAGEALARGAFDEALDAKQRELMNHELYRAAAEARDRVDSALELFKKLDQSDEKLAKNRDMDLVNAARAILANFGIGKTDKTAVDYLAKMKTYDPELYGEIEGLVGAASGTGPVNYQDISYGDFSAMREAVEMLWNVSRATRQITIEGEKVDRVQAQAEMENRIREIGLPENRPGYAQAMTTWEKAQIGLMGMRASLRRVESWVDAMDSGNINGVFRKYIWNPISQSTTAYRMAKREYIQKFLDIVKGVEKSLTPGDIVAKEIGYTFSGKAELLGALLHTGNESNLSKFLRGRKDINGVQWGTYNEDGSLNTARWDAFVSRAWAEGILTKADYDFAQNVWDLLAELKPAAQKAHKEMYGYYFSELTAREFATPFGKYAGGYVPAIVDKMMNADAQIQAERDAVEKFDNSFMFPTTGRGFTKARVDAYAAPLVMDVTMIPGHIDKVLRFAFIEPAVKDVGKIVMDRNFRNVLDAFDPAVGGDMLVPWLQRAATQKIETQTKGLGGRAIDTFFKQLRRRVGMQMMVGNVLNTLQNFTGLSLSAVKVSPGYLKSAIWEYTRAPENFVSMIEEKSDYMKTKETNKIMEVQKTIEDLVLNPSGFETARDFAVKHGYFLQRASQNIIDNITWVGAYNEAVAKGMTEKEAVMSADSVVRLTQGSFAPEDASRFETGTPFMRAFSMFYSYFNMHANLLGTEFIKATRDMGLRKGAGRLLYVYTFGLLIPSLLSEALYKAGGADKWDEDDDGSYLDDFMASFFGSQFRMVSSMVPIAGPVLVAAINRFNNKWYDDRISTSPAVSAIESAVGAPHSVYKAIVDKTGTKGAIKDTLTLLGLLTGYPLAPLGRPLGYLADIAEGKVQPSGPIDYARGLVTGKAGKQ